MVEVYNNDFGVLSEYSEFQWILVSSGRFQKTGH